MLAGRVLAFSVPLRPWIGYQADEQFARMSQKRILIVDDNVIILKALSMKLRARGYDVLTAVDSPGAVSAVRREKPDLMLLDLDFPTDTWNGFVILSWLRRIDEGKKLPVIVITGAESEGCREKCLAAGAADFFLKPIDYEDLEQSIARILKTTVSETAPATEPGKTILFVDDESDWRFMATMYLTDSGYRVLAAADSTEALRHAEAVRPDLIILDLNLAGETGMRLMTLLKAKHPGVPVLLYTGFEHDDATVRRMLGQGANRYLRKGTMEEMLQAVQTALGSVPAPAAAGEDATSATNADAARDPSSVLMLEDNAEFAEVLRLFLESHGFCVTREASGAEGLRQLMAGDFDIIVCDMVMPNMQGDEFYKAIDRAKPHLCKRFVFMTGHQADPRTDRFIRRVHGLMLWKPFPLADLLKAIEIVWDKARHHSAQSVAEPKRLTLA